MDLIGAPLVVVFHMWFAGKPSTTTPGSLHCREALLAEKNMCLQTQRTTQIHVLEHYENHSNMDIAGVH